MGGDPFAAPGETEPFGRRRLDVDLLDAAGAGNGELGAHQRDKGGELGPLGNKCCIEIAETIAAPRHLRHHGAKELEAVNPLETCIVIGEVLADIAGSDGAKEGIAEGMDEDVGIGMT